MSRSIVVTRNMFEALPRDASQFSLRDATARAIERQPEDTLMAGVSPVSIAVFNGSQITRLLQELHHLAEKSDQSTRQDLEDAVTFIEHESIAMGGNGFVSFIGD